VQGMLRITAPCCHGGFVRGALGICFENYCFSAPKEISIFEFRHGSKLRNVGRNPMGDSATIKRPDLTDFYSTS